MLLWAFIKEPYYFADAEGTDVTVDVGECVNICNGWVSGFAGLKVIHTCLIYNIKVCLEAGCRLIAVLIVFGYVKADI